MLFNDIHKLMLAQQETVAQMKELVSAVKQLNVTLKELSNVFSREIVGIAVEPGEPTEH